MAAVDDAVDDNNDYDDGEEGDEKHAFFTRQI